MGENRYFQKALADFVHEAAYGGAVRHLADRGYTAKQITDRLDFPAPYEKVRQAVWEHLADTGVILLEEPGSAICTSTPNSPANHIAGEEMQMQVMVLPPDEDGAGDDQPKSESSLLRPLPSSSLSLSSSSLSLEEELSSSVELSTQHPKQPPECPKILMESRTLSINLKWRASPSVKL